MKPTRNRVLTAPTDRGFTILEIVVAMIIISILTLVMMPTVTNRANQARLTVVEHDLAALAEAESRASIDMNYYVVPWRLNNVIGSDDKGTRGTPIGSHTTPNNMFIDIVTLDIHTNVTDLYNTFILDETAFGWHGPYVNFRQDDNDNNWPDDPWGNDYLLFTKAGGLFPPGSVGITDGEFSTTSPTYTDIDGNSASITNLNGIFDRPTWISLGPNGLPGDGTAATDDGDPGFYGNGDDIKLAFEGYDGSS